MSLYLYCISLIDNVKQKVQNVVMDLNCFSTDRIAILKTMPEKKTPEKKAKDEQIMFRVSAEEKQMLEQVAEADDRTVSDWVRFTVRQRLRELGVLPTKDLGKGSVLKQTK
jgi:predicted HicB family RNase H-like nuclease